jgi:hypothetical protein
MAQPQQQEPASRWDGVLRRSLDCAVKAFDEAGRWVDVVASTDTLDGHGDIVEQSFDLKRYKKNPVVLFLHNSFGCFDGARPEDFLPIGRGDNVKVAAGQLEARIHFASEKASPLAERIFHQFKEGSLNAVSIGFKPGKVTRTENADTGKVTYRLANNELFEISVVPIPSNPDAVAKALHAAEREQLSRMAAPTAAEADPQPKVKRMDPELLQKQLDAAKVDLGVAQKALADEQARVKKLDEQVTELKSDKAKLESELTETKKSLDQAKTARTKYELDALQGKKFLPAEREDIEADVKDLGIDRVLKSLSKRADLPILKGITEQEKDSENHAKGGGAPKKLAARLEKVGS